MATLKCPTCENSALDKSNVQGVAIHSCAKCKGTWLNKGELNRIAHPIEGDLEYCSEDNTDQDRTSGLKCPEPKCKGRQLVKVNFITYSDISLDYCPDCHGIWLDPGELEAIDTEIDKLRKIPESWEHKIMVFLSKLPF